MSHDKTNTAEKIHPGPWEDTIRAAFEAGVKMGAIFHQYIGVPFVKESISSLKTAIEEAVSIQPFVEKVCVTVKGEDLPQKKRHVFDYATLTPERLSAEVTVRVYSARVTSRLQWDEKKGYPLMSIISVESRIDDPANEPYPDTRAEKE